MQRSWSSLLGIGKRRLPAPVPITETKPVRPLPARLVGVGHSHLQAMQDACAQRERAEPSAYRSARFLQMLAPEYNPTIGPDGSLNPALRAAIETALLDETPPLLFDCVSGNEYHFIGLVNHPRPYDFVLPSRPDLPIQPNTEIIPAALARRVLATQAGHAMACLKALRAAVQVPIWHVQSPPPVPSDEHIRQHPTSFAEQVAKRGVANAAFRMKLWLLQSEIYRDQCNDLGIGYVPTPASVCDAEGFLLERGWLPDPAHANMWYGGGVVQQLDALALTQQQSEAS